MVAIWKWIEAMDHEGLKPGYDYYLLVPEDQRLLDELHLQLLMDTGRAILATPGPS